MLTIRDMHRPSPISEVGIFPFPITKMLVQWPHMASLVIKFEFGHCQLPILLFNIYNTGRFNTIYPIMRTFSHSDSCVNQVNFPVSKVYRYMNLFLNYYKLNSQNGFFLLIFKSNIWMRNVFTIMIPKLTKKLHFQPFHS